MPGQNVVKAAAPFYGVQGKTISGPKTHRFAEKQVTHLLKNKAIHSERNQSP